ncbi:MAG: transcription elongation factor GreA [Micrococcales bacterium]|nr:transcription elongation factor GreA [Actinomycetota bacterium]NCA07886.1 transcription elongation factor GreA [Micrococcales bacterium]
MMTSSPTWLTQEAFDRLKAELDQLLNVERQAIAKKIQEAREEGDLKENGGYHAAKDQQGTIEARIARLNQILANSVVGEAPTSSDTVAQGMVIAIELGEKKMEFLLGSAEMAENTDLTVYSPDSPMGSAIMGAKIGDTVSYTAPTGKLLTVKIVAVSHFEG